MKKRLLKKPRPRKLPLLKLLPKKRPLLKPSLKKHLPPKQHLLRKHLLLKSLPQKHLLKTRLRVNPLMLPFVLSLSKDGPSCCLSRPQGRHFDKLSANGV